MNQLPSDQGPFSNYTSAQGTQTNPFTADLKGEFTSNFGTDTNAVSQIFKEGDYATKKTRLYIFSGLGILVVLLAGYFLFFSGDGQDQDVEDIFAENTEESSVLEEAETGDDVVLETSDTELFEGVQEGTEMVGPQVAAEDFTTMPGTSGGATDAPVLESPFDGAARAYDETSEVPTFTWGGSPGGYIHLGRNSSLNGAMRIQVSGNSFQFQSFHPGTWYWKVENDAGTSEIRKFVIEKPIRRNVMLAQPQNGGSLSGNGGVVSWQGDYGIAFYRVELSTNGSWGAPQYRFATSGTELQLQGVQPGQYQMRVGAFSEVARRWEYQDAVTISVQ